MGTAVEIVLLGRVLVTELVALTERALVLAVKLEAGAVVLLFALIGRLLVKEVALTEKALVLVVKLEAGGLVLLFALETEVSVVWAKEDDLER